MAYSTTVQRHKTREVGVDDHVVGGDQPIWVQSMTTTNAFDAPATLTRRFAGWKRRGARSCG